MILLIFFVFIRVIRGLMHYLGLRVAYLRGIPPFDMNHFEKKNRALPRMKKYYFLSKL